jgi:hypothetical protein
MKAKGIIGCEDLSWDKKGHWRCESFDASLFVLMLFKLAVELTILVIHVINWSDRNQCDRKGGEIGSMLFVFGLGGTVLNLVRGDMEFGNDPPWTGNEVRKLVDLTTCRVGATAHCAKTISPTK